MRNSIGRSRCGEIGNPVWHIRHQISSSRVFEFLLSHGIKHIIALQYAHKPGIERQLNNYMSEKCREFNGRITGMATVFPGKNAADFFSLNDILNELK